MRLINPYPDRESRLECHSALTYNRTSIHRGLLYDYDDGGSNKTLALGPAADLYLMTKDSDNKYQLHNKSPTCGQQTRRLTQCESTENTFGNPKTVNSLAGLPL